MLESYTELKSNFTVVKGKLAKNKTGIESLSTKGLNQSFYLIFMIFWAFAALVCIFIILVFTVS